MLAEILPILVVVASVIFLLRYAYLYGHRTRDMPSGPPTLPIIGNLHQIPKGHTHIQFTQWAREYGELYTLKLGSGTMAVVTSRRLVKDVIDKKSSLYSHRPHSYVSHDLITKGNNLLTMQYGDKWRMFRRLIHQYFMEQMTNQYVEIVDAEAVQLIRDFMRRPEEHMIHPRRYSNSITNSIVYGIRSKDTQSDYMKRLYAMMEEWSEVMETGATPPVDIFPALKMLPERLFNNYISKAKGVGQQMKTLYTDIAKDVLKRRKEGNHMESVFDRFLDQQDKTQLSWEELCFLAGVLMEGGSDTSSTLILTIVQALMLNPDVQRIAHEEMDRVVGPDRTPVWEDMKQLPYINAIVKEGHRWRPILPLSFPHALGEDDWIDGKFLPKGTIVVINTWGMHMLESAQPPSSSACASKPLSEFDPERFISYDLLAPEYVPGKWEARDHYGYGVSRRICPGIHLAERSMLLAIAKLVWAFKFEKLDDKTYDVDPITGYHQGFVFCPKNYEVKVKVRGEKRRETVECEFGKYEKDIFAKFSSL